MSTIATRRARRANKVRLGEYRPVEGLSMFDRKLAELHQTGRTNVSNYGTALMLKRDAEDTLFGMVPYIRTRPNGWMVEMVKADPAEEPRQMSEVLKVVCLAEELGTTATDLLEARPQLIEKSSGNRGRRLTVYAEPKPWG